MRLLFVHSHKFIKSNQDFYTTGQLPYELFKSRYLNNFQKVIICSRVIKGTDRKNLNQSNGRNVTIKELPNLSVIKKRQKAFKLTKIVLEKEIKKADVIVARMPSIHANIAMKIAKKHNKTLVVEVVGDIFESLWNHGSLLGKIIAPISALKYTKSIKNSKYTIYVTKEQLQKKYPSKENAYTINASNVELDATSETVLYKKMEQEKSRSKNNLTIGLIGSFATKHKGIHNAIDLIDNLSKKGIVVELHVLGSGDKKWLIERAKSLGISKSIYFHGFLPPGKPVLEWLDKLDLYIQPSLTEGLPRALIEAMSRGLPVVASNVGGIPELLEPDFLHEPNNSKDLFNKVFNLIKDKNKILSQSERNFEKAKEYNVDILKKRRNDFWENIIKKELLK